MMFSKLQCQCSGTVICAPHHRRPSHARNQFIFEFHRSRSVLCGRNSIMPSHELGHDLGLYHSGADTQQYADSSGNMGNGKFEAFGWSWVMGFIAMVGI
jgi:hypothetical protein